MKNIKKYITLVFIFVLVLPVCSQDENENENKILISGTVNDIYTKAPVQAKLAFRDKEGNAFFAESHPRTGMYQVFIPAGGEYNVILKGADILQKEEKVFIKDIKVSELQKITFRVKKYSEGMIIDSSDVFVENTSDLNEASSYILKYFEEAFQYNINTKFALYITSWDCDLQDKTKAEIQNLMQERRKVLYDITSKWPGTIKIDILLHSHQSEEQEKNSNDIFIKVIKTGT